MAPLAAREVMKATIIHELAHSVTTFGRGATANELHDFVLHADNLKKSEVETLRRKLITTTAKQKTSEKFRVPWEVEPEAGRWIEYKVFGGILAYQEATATRNSYACLDYGLGLRFRLTFEMLLRSHSDIFVNFPKKIAPLFQAQISPSPSHLPKENSTNTCNGALPQFSPDETRRALEGIPLGQAALALSNSEHPFDGPVTPRRTHPEEVEPSWQEAGPSDSDSDSSSSDSDTHFTKARRDASFRPSLSFTSLSPTCTHFRYIAPLPPPNSHPLSEQEATDSSSSESGSE
ncbi:hypothetical protein C8J57DRAFT_1302536 [Mycena rebaudengoi]|nr:hypothetical protein C8J57DRAFT_1302536 [Mycena rebaudengoi]